MSLLQDEKDEMSRCCWSQAKNLSTQEDLGAPRCCFYGLWIIIFLFLISLLKVLKKNAQYHQGRMSHNNQIEMLVFNSTSMYIKPSTKNIVKHYNL